jgi:hypothetical protein
MKVMFDDSQPCATQCWSEQWEHDENQATQERQSRCERNASFPHIGHGSLDGNMASVTQRFPFQLRGYWKRDVFFPPDPGIFSTFPSTFEQK